MSTPDGVDRGWLDAAVRIASPHLGTTAENPTVGALVVDPETQVLLGRGVTAPGGRPHAEPQALAQAGEGAHGATLYVTLEPCNHWGRTPPCVEAVLRTGIGRVVIGRVDPDPRTAGQSVRKMEAAGLEVAVLDHAPSRRLHEGFVSRVGRGRPFVSAKLAVSADGMVGRPFEANVPITGPIARRWTHMQRATSDAILTGGSTAIIDNPQLTVRLKGLEQRSPRRFVLAGAEPLSPELNLFDPSLGPQAEVIATPDRLLAEGIPVCRLGGRGRPDLGRVLEFLGENGIGRLLVEGGPTLTEAFLALGLVDRFYLLQSPQTIGSDGQPAIVHDSMENRLHAAGLAEVDRRSLGDDMVRTFERVI